jgi:hypothetical protein
MLDETVGLLLYEYFKHETIVEHLMGLVSRYTRCALLYPHTAEDAFRYLSGWVAALTQLRNQLDELVRQDDEWLAFERAAQWGSEPPETVIRTVFETQIDWCLTFVETCMAYTQQRQGRPRTRLGFDRFTAHAQHAWVQLTRPSGSSGGG